MEQYCASLAGYKRLPTREVKIGNLSIGNGNPIRIQTMTTTDTMDVAATVAQTIRCIEAGAELVRITAPSKKEAEQLQLIKDELRARGYDTPLVADIHFTPNAAEIAARIVEKVRVNPGNYIDKKKFDFIEYTDAEYAAEVDRIRERFTPLVRICREHGTAMRIGTNHGSLSDRIMSRYGDTPIGMVESAMEFLRIARSEDYHQIVLSMKSSNPQVMVQAYRLLVRQMMEEFGECYPLHLGVTEAGDGEDGRIKSAIGIGTLLEDGIGDTIRVSLTEDPEFEIPVCKDIVARYPIGTVGYAPQLPASLPYSPFEYKRRETVPVGNIGGHQVPVVVADMSKETSLTPESLKPIGYDYDAASDKWKISDGAADYIYTGSAVPAFGLPGTLQVITDEGTSNTLHLMPVDSFMAASGINSPVFIGIHLSSGFVADAALLARIKECPAAVLVISADGMKPVRSFITLLMLAGITNPVILRAYPEGDTPDKHLIKLATDCGGLLLDGMGDGVMLSNTGALHNVKVSGRTYLEVKNNEQFLNNTAFSILQATRTRISKTEYISCPSCGRTLFDLQETTAKIRAATHHLKGVKIAIMGCIVNGPGEMADADFGYVGSGPGKITLYKGKEVVKRNVPSDIAVQELIGLLKENDAWVDMAAV
ncbi:MAG: (E)-4-hydroxy-3-methylbut-2-enyl-diphosphate synthase [Flavipsychrobacter sp.]|nr:(E)-4-hydroxy-3-methylbut-2-enyl-diphosphate synthase [Flavipsychrobacter sp.]